MQSARTRYPGQRHQTDTQREIYPDTLVRKNLRPRYTFQPHGLGRLPERIASSQRERTLTRKPGGHRALHLYRLTEQHDRKADLSIGAAIDVDIVWYHHLV